MNLLKLIQDATPGEWETGQAQWNEDGDVCYTLHGIKEAKVSDCMLIAASRTALPEALELITELKLALKDAAKTMEGDGYVTTMHDKALDCVTAFEDKWLSEGENT